MPLTRKPQRNQHNMGRNTTIQQIYDNKRTTKIHGKGNKKYQEQTTQQKEPQGQHTGIIRN